ncbi:MAG: hypothetical protein ACJ8IK_09710 [Burkholderiaceae bacterium]
MTHSPASALAALPAVTFVDRSATKRFRKILITGLGRSGTSAIAALLRSCDFYFGEDAGAIVLESPAMHKLAVEGQTDALRAQLETWEASRPRIAWKDPKLYARSAQFVESLPDDWLLIVTFRDPASIAMRRVYSDKVDFVDSMRHCILHQGRLCEFAATSNKSVLWVSYERLMLEPARTLEGLMERLDLGDFPAPSTSELQDAMSGHRQAYRDKHDAKARQRDTAA